MSNLILLIQTPADLEKLNATIPVLRDVKMSSIWVFYNLAAVVDVKQLYAGIDARIAALDAEIKRASQREDFASAATYKEQRDAAVLEKATAAKDAVTKLPKEQLDAAVKAAFTTFWEAKLAPNVEISASPEHYETRDWVQMLHARLGDWPSAVLPHGGFIVAWPGQVLGLVGAKENVLPPTTVTSVLPTPSEVTPAVTPAQRRTEKEPERVAKAPSVHPTKTPRYIELNALHIDRVYEEAKKVGIANPSGTKQSIIFAIIRAEKDAPSGDVLA